MTYQAMREDGNADNGVKGFGGNFGAPGSFLAPGISFRVQDGFNTFSNLIEAQRPPRVDPALVLYGTPTYMAPEAGRAPYFVDWNLTLENSFTSNSVFRVSYHANVGVRLLNNKQNFNQLDPRYWDIYGDLLGRRLDDPLVIATGFQLPYPGYPTNRLLQQALRPYLQYGGINSGVGGENSGHSTYHALESSFKYRFRNGLYFLGSYTFSKLLTNVEGENPSLGGFVGEASGAQQNQYNRSADKSVSNQDTPHNLVLSYIYELPVGKGKPLLSDMNRVANAFLGKHLLYRNNGDGTFADVSRQAGFADSPGKGLGVAIGDADADGWMDIVVANDSFPQQLFLNSRRRTFREAALSAGLAFDDSGQTFAGMGIDFADFDNDGAPDVFVNALANQKYALFRDGKGSLEYVSGPTNVGAISALHSGWGAKFADFDNDGWKDLFVAQGHVTDNISLTQPWIKYLEPPVLMRNSGGKFVDVSSVSGEVFQVALAARGAAFGDLNDDGNVDVVINCNNGPAVILWNEGRAASHWILINAVGSVSNRDGIGAQVLIVSESGARQHATVSAGGSYLSSSDKRAHFGLGADKEIKLLQITWPSGVVQRLENIMADQVLTVRESSTQPSRKK